MADVLGGQSGLWKVRQLSELMVIFEEGVKCSLDGGGDLIRVEQEEVKDGNVMVVNFGVVLCNQSRGECVKQSSQFLTRRISISL